MADDRRAVIATTIRRLAQDDAAPITIGHVCRACQAVLGVDGVSLYLVDDFGVSMPAYATNALADHAAELEVTVGRGPGMQAVQHREAMLLADVTSRSGFGRWPVLAPQLLSPGVRAVFAFPLARFNVAVGALELYRAHAGALSAAAVVDGRLFAEYALSLLVDSDSERPMESVDEVLGLLEQQWARVHQAVGVVSVQLRTGPTQAYQCLRGHAFATGRPLRQVAEEVLDGRIDFMSWTRW